MNLLQIGDYARGFAECEWRPLNGFHCPHPKWDGHPIPEKTLVIYTEQGAGDALQFARYLPLAAKRCKNLILACPTELMPIFATIPGISQIREPGQIGVAEFDTYLPLTSLPHVFKTTLDTIPATVPYLDAAALRRRKDNPSLLLPSSDYPRIGIVWAGNSNNPSDRHRSCSLHEFLPILNIPEITFYSLQKGARHEDLTDLPSNIQVKDLEPQLGDFGRPGGNHRPVGSSHQRRFSSGAYGRRIGEKSLDAAESRSRLALDVRGRDHSLVSDDAAVSPDSAW